MIIDILICLLFASMLMRGREIGLVRQVFSAAGFFGGLFFGAVVLEPHIVTFGHTPLSRAILTMLSTIGVALVLLSISEYVGLSIKSRLQSLSINRLDTILGAVAGGLTLLGTVWLVAPVFASLPFQGVQSAVHRSFIVGKLNANLPSAPNVIADLSHIIDPNGFPQVFSGVEPSPPANTSLPDLGSMQAAVRKDEASVVKIEGRGCGGVVEGSGFVAAKGIVITNAHVVAGVKNPYVVDSNGTRPATAIWFDPNLDIAVLTTSDLAGKPLNIATGSASAGTPGAVLGYPGGGPFTAGAARVLQSFNAVGQNIYNQGSTTRSVYELKATIIPGNSGGPLIAQDGAVIGVVFAESTTYNQVGYALATAAVANGLQQAKAQHTPVTTGTCAE